MTSYFGPPIYAAFVWWFSTGAVLILVGLSARFESLRIISALALLGGSVAGLAATADDVRVGAAFAAFTCTICLWGAQEIAFLAGWITGPRPEPCPAGATGARRLGFALQAILYHEAVLLISGAVIAALTWGAANQIALWTFAALWVLRQSAKINLFLGVPVTNDEFMPDSVQFLKTYFARKTVSAFFPVSVTIATAVLVIMIQRIVEVAATPYEIAGLALVSTLFALGVVEHWFMLLPLPAMTLWGWGLRSRAPAVGTAAVALAAQPPARAPSMPCASTAISGARIAAPETRSGPQLVALASAHQEMQPTRNAGLRARQKLEDEFRRRFLEQHARDDLAAVRRTISAEPAVTANGRAS